MKLPLEKPFLSSDSLEMMMFESIGTQNEKTLHKSIKFYLCEDVACHEFRIGRFIADIYQDGHIYEIQTASFLSLKSKLEKLLPLYKISLVYPIIRRKTIIEMDALSGSKKPKKSPRVGKPLQVMRELVKIKTFLTDPNFEMIMFMTDVDEYRMKSMSTFENERINQIPKGVPELIRLKTQTDYLELLPSNLNEQWTVKDLKTVVKRSLSDTQSFVQVLKQLDLIEMCGKEGRAYLYRIKGDGINV